MRFSSRQSIMFGLLRKRKIVSIDDLRKEIAKEEGKSEDDITRRSVNGSMKYLIAKAAQEGITIRQNDARGQGALATYQLLKGIGGE